MPSETHVHDRILTALPGAHVEVVDTTGTGDHFRTVVVAEQFRSMSRVQQHQAIYAALEGEMGDHAIHALAITTRVPDAQETPA